MVAALGPVKFYGSSLPRPRIYTDIKFNHERVDPPVSVVDPLMSWANEAHWTMGGLCTKRLRLQGRIEGNISKLRAQNEKRIRDSPLPETFIKKTDLVDEETNRCDSPPPAPVAGNRKRRFMAMIEEEEVEEEERVVEKKRKPARKLINEFDSVATRRSPRSGGVGVERQSVGGSFVSKMKKAAESLASMRSVVSEDESSGKLRVSPRLLNKRM